jgi:tetratricopeptide (TPR) repeat protein
MRSNLFVLILLVIFLLVPVVCAEDALEWYSRGQNSAAAGDYTAAITYYNNALAQDPKYGPALSGKAASLNAQGKYADALPAADAALALRASDAVALNARALALFGMGNYNESVTAYDRLFAVQVISLDAYCNQGYAYYELERYDASVISYDRCVAINPQNFMASNYQGLAYMASKKYDNALTSFDRGTSVTVKNATLWNSWRLTVHRTPSNVSRRRSALTRTLPKQKRTGMVQWANSRTSRSRVRSPRFPRSAGLGPSIPHRHPSSRPPRS